MVSTPKNERFKINKNKKTDRNTWKKSSTIKPGNNNAQMNSYCAPLGGALLLVH